MGEQGTLEYEELAVKGQEATGDTQSCLCNQQGECTVGFWKGGSSTAANKDHKAYAHAEGLLPGEKPEGEMGGEAETS